MSNPADATRADREKALIAYRVHHSHINPYELRPEDEEWLNTGLSHASWYYRLPAILAAVVAARLEERAKCEQAAVKVYDLAECLKKTTRTSECQEAGRELANALAIDASVSDYNEGQISGLVVALGIIKDEMG